MLEALVREMPAGLVIFDREGFLIMANQAARSLLEADTWSRRRYPEVFTARSILVTLIEDCLEKGKGFRRERLTYTFLSGRTQNLEVSLSPLPRSERANCRGHLPNCSAPFREDPNPVTPVWSLAFQSRRMNLRNSSREAHVGGSWRSSPSPADEERSLSRRAWHLS